VENFENIQNFGEKIFWETMMYTVQ